MFKEGTGIGLSAIVRAGFFITVIFPLALLGQNSPNIVWTQSHSDRVNSVVFTPDNSTVISGSSDRLINLWKVGDGTLVQSLNSSAAAGVHENSIEAVAINPSGNLIASVSYKAVKLWHLPDGTAQALSGHSDWVVDCAFSPNGQLLATASFDTTVRIWKVSDGGSVKVITGNEQMRAVAFSPDGSLLATAGDDKVVTLRKTSDWSVAQVFSGHTDGIYTLAFSPNGAQVASGGYDKTLKVWNVSSGSLAYSLGNNNGNVYAAAFSPDGTLLAYSDGEGNTLRIVRASDGAILQTYNSNVDNIQTIAFANNNLIAYGRADNAVVVANINGTSTPTITSPHDGDTFTAPATVTINASAGTANGSVTSMQFFADSTKLGEDSSAPYTFQWNNVPAGTYNLTVRQIDSHGGQTVSAPVTVTVGDSQPNSVTLTSPGDGTTFVAPATITLTATANMDAGVAAVEFFQNGQSIGEKSNAPYTLSWKDVSPGTYSLTAVVTDDNGQTVTSDPVSVTVNNTSSDRVKPRVAVTSPANGARLTSADITLSGTASDNVAVAQVLVSLNGADFQPADGTTQWTLALELAPGRNTVKVKSVDTSGNESAVITDYFTYVVTSPLTVNTEGSGRVVPNRNGQVLEVGKQFSMQAIPSSGFLFNGWTGDSITNTNSATIVFTMQENMIVQANFIANPFIPLKGLYVGLIQSDPPSAAGSGFIRLSVTTSGTFTARITFGTRAFSLTGKFNNDGSFSRTLNFARQQQISLSLQLHVADDSSQVTGSITNADVTAAIVADRAIVASSANPVTQAGRYTFLMPANTDDPDAPQGPGAGAVTIDRAGNVRISGRTGDFVSFSQTTVLSKNGTWPLFIWRLSGNDIASGLITVRDVPAVSDMDGTVNWFRQPIARATRFSSGFTTQVNFIGSTFTNVPGTSLLDFGSGTNNARVEIGGGNVSPQLAFPATLNGKNQLVVTSPNTNKFSMSFSRSTGAITGTFINPTTGKSTPYVGSVFQKQNQAEGCFLGQTQTGFVLLQPAQ